MPHVGLRAARFCAALNRNLYNLQVWITPARVTGSDVAAHVISVLSGDYKVDPVRCVAAAACCCRLRGGKASSCDPAWCLRLDPAIACAQAPYTTTGQRIFPGRGLRKSLMEVSDDICWYLDATFCYGFNRYRESGHDVEQVIQARSHIAIWMHEAARSAAYISPGRSSTNNHARAQMK